MGFPEYFRERTDTGSRVCYARPRSFIAVPAETGALLLFRVFLFGRFAAMERLLAGAWYARCLTDGLTWNDKFSVQENADEAKQKHPIAMTRVHRIGR